MITIQTMQLRFVERDGKKVLQQAVMNATTGEIIWSDVPLVKDDAPTPSTDGGA